MILFLPCFYLYLKNENRKKRPGVFIGSFCFYLHLKSEKNDQVCLIKEKGEFTPFAPVNDTDYYFAIVLSTFTENEIRTILKKTGDVFVSLLLTVLHITVTIELFPSSPKL